METLLSLVLAGSVLISVAEAFEANKRSRLSPETRLKVNKAVARSYSLGNDQAERAQSLGLGRSPSSCGNLSLGNIGPNRAGRIDNTTVVLGDVINVNRNTRCR